MALEDASSREAEAPPPPSDRRPGSGVMTLRSWSRALVVLGSLAAIGVAGHSLWKRIPPHDPAREAGDAASDAGAPAGYQTFGSRLTVARVESGGPGDPTVVVALGRATSPAQESLIFHADPRRLLNEIVRQAILTAAHGERAALSRDAAIGEEAPAATTVSEADVAWLLSPTEEYSTLSISPHGKDAKRYVFPLPRADPDGAPAATTYPRVLERAEQLSRQELPKVLKALRVEGEPVVVKAEGALPEGVDGRLSTMTFTEQFAALRAIHAAIRADGESPERLGGLVRGYANLGVLTESHWSPAHDVFKARALLLAQRLVARQSRSARALEHRAYAYALAGLHRCALDDIAAARALPDGAYVESDRSRLIDAYCKYQTRTLLEYGPRADRELALLLASKTVEGTSSHVRRVELGRAMLRENPECYRVHDAVCAAGGVSVLHEATTAPFVVYAREVPRRLRKIDDVPPGIPPDFNEAEKAAAAANVLIAAGRSADRGAPSWGVLGRLMRETCFLQVWRRARFLAFGLGVPADDFVQAARPLVADHPYHSFIESFGVDRARDPARYAALVREVDIPATDVEITECPFYVDILAAFNPHRSTALFWEAALREDRTEHDLKLFLPRISGPKLLPSARHLEDVSPHSPSARATRIEHGWDEVAAQAPAWEKDDSPEVLLALGRRYLALGRHDDARRCLERCLELAPDKRTYETLAHVFRTQGDWKRWRETLDRFLSGEEDYGLDHANVQVQIANHLMSEGRWKEAEPYAAAAAESWAAFAMDCACRCYEGLGDWQNAELWARRNTERYPGSNWGYWYALCVRTGRGDVDAAREFAARYVASIGDQAAGIDRIAFGFFHLMNGRKEQALAMFRDANGDDAVVPGVLYSALTADALGDSQFRDKCLERLTTDSQCLANSKSTPIFRLYRAALSAGGGAPLDPAAFERELAALPEPNREGASFHIGWFLMLHGTPEQARLYLIRSANANSVFSWIRLTAQEALRDPARILGRVSPAGEKGTATGP